MKVIYDQSADTLTIIFAETPVAESDEDKPGAILDYDDKVQSRFIGDFRRITAG